MKVYNSQRANLWAKEKGYSYYTNFTKLCQSQFLNSIIFKCKVKKHKMKHNCHKIYLGLKHPEEAKSPEVIMIKMLKYEFLKIIKFICYYFLDSACTNVIYFLMFLTTGEINVYLAKTVQLFWIIVNFFSLVTVKMSFYYKGTT